MNTVKPEHWMKFAACRDLAPKKRDKWFFPERGQSTEHGKRLCAVCPCAKACLNYAVDNHIRHGIWGGKSAEERRVMLNRRTPAA